MLSDGRIQIWRPFSHSMISVFRSLLVKIVGLVSQRGPTEVDLSHLLDIGSPKAFRRASSASVLNGTCVAQGLTARSYCSRTIATLNVKCNSGPTEILTTEWRMDFVQPDCFHVKQRFNQSGEFKFDEWVTLGTEHYVRIPLWLRDDNQRNSMLNTFLLVNKYLHVMKTVDPCAGGTVRCLMGEYLCLEYELNTVKDMTAFCEALVSYVTRPQGNCRVSVWVDLRSMRLVKGQVRLTGQSEDGSEASLDLRQAFNSYDDDVLISRPRIGLEPLADSPGTCVITDNRIYPVPFHL